MNATTVPDDMNELLNIAIDEVEMRYPLGCLKHVRQRHEDLYQKIREVEDALTEIWCDGYDDTRLERFRDKLREWYNLFMEAIRVFKLENMKESS